MAVRASDEGMKWLEWPEYLNTVQELRLECAGRNHMGSLRVRSAVAWSLQRYLIFAILSSIPDRSLAHIISPVLMPIAMLPVALLARFLAICLAL